jgi:hypothetical protein
MFMRCAKEIVTPALRSFQVWCHRLQHVAACGAESDFGLGEVALSYGMVVQ